MKTGTWRLGIGHVILLTSEAGDAREVNIASGEPPTRGDVATRIARNSARYEETDDAIRCFDGFGGVAWVCEKAPEETVIAEWQPQATEAPVSAPEPIAEGETQGLDEDAPEGCISEEA